MKLKVNQLEYERASLLNRFVHVDVQVPQLATAEAPVTQPFMGGFDDVGDEVAKVMGLDVFAPPEPGTDTLDNQARQYNPAEVKISDLTQGT